MVLPDHLHCLWRLPPDDDDFPMRWRLIRAYFSRMLTPDEGISASRKRKGERGIWQHLIRDERDLQNHLDYIHYNPLKHGHVTRTIDWPHSSFHRYVERGAYPENWVAQSEVIALVSGD